MECLLCTKFYTRTQECSCSLAAVPSARGCAHFCPVASRLAGVSCKVSPHRLPNRSPGGKGVLLGRSPCLLSQQLQGLSQQTLAPARGRLLLSAFLRVPALCFLIPPLVWLSGPCWLVMGIVTLEPATPLAIHRHSPVTVGARC